MYRASPQSASAFDQFMYKRFLSMRPDDFRAWDAGANHGSVPAKRKPPEYRGKLVLTNEGVAMVVKQGPTLKEQTNLGERLAESKVTELAGESQPT